MHGWQRGSMTPGSWQRGRGRGFSCRPRRTGRARRPRRDGRTARGWRGLPWRGRRCSLHRSACGRSRTSRGRSKGAPPGPSRRPWWGGGAGLRRRRTLRPRPKTPLPRLSRSLRGRHGCRCRRKARLPACTARRGAASPRNRSRWHSGHARPGMGAARLRPGMRTRARCPWGRGRTLCIGSDGRPS